jgi:SAM-dependent methyltransferase
LKAALTEFLRSPIDGSPLALEKAVQTNTEIVAGELIDASDNRFRIVNGVPVFAPEAGKNETFSFKWKLIGDSYGYDEPTRSTRQNWYLERFGSNSRSQLIDFLKEKKMILDAGTGSGVDAVMFAESGATVIAIDLSQDAALATYHHLGHLPNVHVLQADLNRLPFAPSLFDYISCDQVLHHTPNTEKSLSTLVKYLGESGHLALYVYKRKSPIREFTDDYLRNYTTKMTAEECYEFCRGVTLLGKALSGLKAEVFIPQDIPLLEIKSGRQDVQRFFYWNVMKCFWNDDYDFTTNVVINFDWYHPKYAWRYTPEEVCDWYKKHGLEIERLNIVESGIAVLGKLSIKES